MKVLFVENRYKTYFFEAVAEQLIKSGIDVCFLIQNRNFLPKKKFEQHVIPYPKKIVEDCSPAIEAIENIIKSDRQQNHFNKKSKSYFYYYYRKIDRVLDEVKPNYVFGESTAFHELLTIALCKKKSILYLNPSSCRYPIGRFCFYKFDTLEPYKGSGEILSDTVALDTIKGITNRTAKPDYMKGSKTSFVEKTKNKIKLIKGYMEGERFNTPNPLIKAKLEKQKKRNIEQWDLLSRKNKINDSGFKVLYPLQMQPEANIDVWGKAYRNQTKLILNIIKNLPKNCLLFIKPNPKSKYEITDELIEVVKRFNKCIAIEHSIKMEDIIKEMDLVITVTGTIAIECVLNNKPIITLVDTLNSKANNCIYLESLDSNLRTIIKKIANNDYTKLTNAEKTDYINHLNATSFKGVVSDPFTDSNCIGSDNIANIVYAFQCVLT